MKNKGKDNIPVYDICSLADIKQMQEDIIAERLADYLARHPGLHFPHRHSFYHVVYFTAGRGSHTIDFEQFPVKAGQIYFMIPGQVHTWNFKGKVDGYIINFSSHLLHFFFREKQYLEQFTFLNGVARDGVLQLGQSAETAEALFEAIISETKANEMYSYEMIRMHLLSLFIHIARDTAPGHVLPETGKNRMVIHQFRKLVEQHFNHKRLPKEYASMLFVTPNHLNALCQDLLGMKAGELIRERVLLEAKRLLVSAGLSISEIAWQLDFRDNSYFSKFFKKYTGMSPESFRGSVEH